MATAAELLFPLRPGLVPVPATGQPATTYGESTTELATPTYLRPTPERSDTSACQAAAAIESYQAPDGYHA